MSSLKMVRCTSVTIVLFIAAMVCHGQTNGTQQGSNAQLEECISVLDPNVFPPETCPTILGYMFPQDQLGPVSEDGSFFVFSPGSDGKLIARTFYPPPRLRSEIALNSTNNSLSLVAEDSKDFRAVWPKGTELWAGLLSIYCYYHPNGVYKDLTNHLQPCIFVKDAPDEKTMDADFEDAVLFKTNVAMLISSAGVTQQAHESNSSQPTQEVVNAPTQIASTGRLIAESSHSQPNRQQPPICAKNVSFAVAHDGQVAPVVPRFAEKWVSKNRKKYLHLCFSQAPLRDVMNYLLVFANSESAFSGIYPKMETTISTSVTPVSGSGTVTDSYGEMWNYTYDGTVTTETTNTEYANLPYIDRSNTLYLTCYDENGVYCGQYARTVTTRSGGDPYNTLGYNLGSALGAIHMKQRLLHDAVKHLSNGQ